MKWSDIIVELPKKGELSKERAARIEEITGRFGGLFVSPFGIPTRSPEGTYTMRTLDSDFDSIISRVLKDAGLTIVKTITYED